jgi:hypothetical protein
MKGKLLIVSALLFFSLAGSAQTSNNVKLHFDGLYHTMSDSLNPFRFYLRFYTDGTVIGYTTAGNPERLIQWFSKDHPAPSKGRYALKDTAVSFSLKSEEGDVIYEGSVLPDNRLWLTVKSLINKYVGKETYFFWHVDGLK